METPEERDRRLEDERDLPIIARDPAADDVARQILDTPLTVKLTPRQIVRLISLVDERRYTLESLAEREYYDQLGDHLGRALSQLGGRT